MTFIRDDIKFKVSLASLSLALAGNNLNNFVQPCRSESAAVCSCCEKFIGDRKYISPDCTEQFEVPQSDMNKLLFYPKIPVVSLVSVLKVVDGAAV